MVSDIPIGDGKIGNLFFTVKDQRLLALEVASDTVLPPAADCLVKAASYINIVNKAVESGDIYKEKVSLEEGQKQEANGIVSGWEEGELHAPLAAQPHVLAVPLLTSTNGELLLSVY